MRTARTLARADLGALAADWLTLLRPRIAGFVFFSAFVAGMLGSAADLDLWRVAEAALWVTLAAGSASVFNQVLERDTDALMERTRTRPLPCGRITPRDALLFGAALLVVGCGALALRFNLLAAFLALATTFAYVALYTPLKRLSSLNTVVGALPGAAPPLLGYVALAGAPGPWAWVLFAIVFTWQFPHFMAIAWLNREDYRRADMRMLPALPGTDGLAGRQALLYSLVLLPLSLLPGARGDAGIVFTLGALVFGLAYAACSLRFALREDASRARALLLCSLVYLPCLHTLALLDPVVRPALLYP